MKSSGERFVGKVDTLSRIKEAENEAKSTLAEADAKSMSVIAAARKEALEKVQSAEAARRAKSADTIDQEKKSLAEKHAELLRKGNEEASAISSKANERILKAKTYIEGNFERALDAITGTNE